MSQRGGTPFAVDPLSQPRGMAEETKVAEMAEGGNSKFRIGGKSRDGVLEQQLPGAELVSGTSMPNLQPEISRAAPLTESQTERAPRTARMLTLAESQTERTIGQGSLFSTTPGILGRGTRRATWNLPSAAAEVNSPSSGSAVASELEMQPMGRSPIQGMTEVALDDQLETAVILDSSNAHSMSSSPSSRVLPSAISDGSPWDVQGADVGGGSLNTPREGTSGILSTFGRSSAFGQNRRPSFFLDNVPLAETHPMWYTDKIIAFPIPSLVAFLFLPAIFTIYVFSTMTIKIDIGVDAFTIVPTHFSRERQDALVAAIAAGRDARSASRRLDLGSEGIFPIQYTNSGVEPSGDIFDKSLSSSTASNFFSAGVTGAVEWEEEQPRWLAQSGSEFSLGANQRAQAVYSQWQTLVFNDTGGTSPESLLWPVAASALQNRRERRKSSYHSKVPSKGGRRLDAGVSSLLGRVEVVFVDESENNNVLRSGCFPLMKEVESFIQSQPGYDDWCINADGTGVGAPCEPPQSLLTYYYPSLLPNGDLVFDGRGSTLLGLDATVAGLTKHDESYWFLENTFGPDSLTSRLSAKTGRTTNSAGTIQNGECKLTVIVGGNHLTEAQVLDYLNRDLVWASISFVFVFVYTLCHTGSLMLTTFALLQIFLSFPTSFFLYVKWHDDLTLGILNVLSVYIMIGIGIDDVYVFLDAFKQSVALDELPLRLAFTMRRAAKAMFITSFTTSVAFLSNYGIQIPVVQSFAVLMAILVAVNYLLVITVFPAVLVVWHLKVAPTELEYIKAIQGALPAWIGGRGSTANTQDIFDPDEGSAAARKEPEPNRLMNHKQHTNVSQSGYFAVTAAYGDGGAKSGTGERLRSTEIFFRDKLTPWVCQYKIHVMAALVVWLIAALSMALQLEPSKDIPGLFDDSNNVQMFLELQTEFTGERHCRTCTAPHVPAFLCEGVNCGQNGTCSRARCKCDEGFRGPNCEIAAPTVPTTPYPSWRPTRSPSPAPTPSPIRCTDVSADGAACGGDCLQKCSGKCMTNEGVATKCKCQSSEDCVSNYGCFVVIGDKEYGRCESASNSPTRSPTKSPTTLSPSTTTPTMMPSTRPSESPSRAPSSKSPTVSLAPTPGPTAPSVPPTQTPSTHIPTEAPSWRPSLKPTTSPTAPTITSGPTSSPTFSPVTSSPSNLPSFVPSSIPSKAPTLSQCANEEKDGTETDEDCGGICPKCANGKQCTANADCANGFCSPDTQICDSSAGPSSVPTLPTTSPTAKPSRSPSTAVPTSSPTTTVPTSGPTSSPTTMPTSGSPSKAPIPSTVIPTITPTTSPTSAPSAATKSPTMSILLDTIVVEILNGAICPCEDAAFKRGFAVALGVQLSAITFDCGKRGPCDGNNRRRLTASKHINQHRILTQDSIIILKYSVSVNNPETTKVHLERELERRGGSFGDYLVSHTTAPTTAFPSASPTISPSTMGPSVAPSTRPLTVMPTSQPTEIRVKFTPKPTSMLPPETNSPSNPGPILTESPAVRTKFPTPFPTLDDEAKTCDVPEAERELYCSGNGVCKGKSCSCLLQYSGDRCENCAEAGRTPPNCLKATGDGRVPINTNTATISVVWGIDDTRTKQPRQTNRDADDQGRQNVIVKYIDAFDFAHVEMQNHFVRSCATMSTASDLLQPHVIASCEHRSLRCLVLEFRDNVREVLGSDSWPVRDRRKFYSLFKQFINKNSVYNNDIGWDEQRTKITWFRVECHSNMRTYLPGYTALDWYNQWQTLINNINSKCAVEGCDAYQTSYLWEGAFTEIVAVNGTLWSVAIVSIVSLCCIFVFTSSMRLSIAVMITVLAILTTTVSLFWLFGWSLGIIEALAISILLGSSVDYSLHIAHSYLDACKHCPPNRTRGDLVRFAVTSVGVSVLHAAITTFISVMMLLACSIAIFRKAGGIIALSVVVSVGFALLPLLALLLCPFYKFFMSPLHFHASVRRTLFSFFCVGFVFGIVVLLFYILDVSGAFVLLDSSGQAIF